MGEAKCRRQAFDEAGTRLSQALADQGKLIEAGWVIFATSVVPKDAPSEQRGAMQLAFMAGAQHLFGAINQMLTPDDEPTEADMERMELIANELERWAGVLSQRIAPSRGSA